MQYNLNIFIFINQQKQTRLTQGFQEVTVLECTRKSVCEVS